MTGGFASEREAGGERPGGPRAVAAVRGLGVGGEGGAWAAAADVH